MKKIIVTIILFNLIFAYMVNPFFAAVISDNDGAAFVTKAEFEALKKNFNNQVENYENSIDSKIDGSIASYLAGMRLQKTTPEKMIHYDWTNIEFLNYEIKPENKIPNYRWWVTAGWYSDGSYSGGGPAYDKKSANVCGYKKFDRVWGNYETNIRPTAKLLYGSETNIGKVAWNGCAARWNESWFINKIAWGKCSNMVGTTGYRVNLYHPLSFITLGYVKGKTIKQLLTARMDFEHSSGGTWYIATLNSSNLRERLPYAYEDGNFSFSVTLDELGDGTKTVHDHIFIENGAATQQYLSVDSFINTINNCDYQLLRDSDFGAVTGAQTKVTGSRLIYLTRDNYDAGYMGTINWEYENCYMPLVGLLPTHYYAKDIYQEAYSVDSSYNVLNRTITWNGKTLNDAPPLTLNNGLEVCISEVEKEYEWEIDFDEVTLYKSSAVTNQNEVDVYLSTVPFGDGVSTTAPLKVKVDGEEKDYFTTTDRKGKFKWEVDDPKIIYMKCKPHFNSTDTGNEYYFIRLSDNAKYINVIS